MIVLFQRARLRGSLLSAAVADADGAMRRRMGGMHVAQLLGVGWAMGWRGVVAEMCEGAALDEFERCADARAHAHAKRERERERGSRPTGR
eukprot:COSAG02_NODE_4_length_69935_cov_46.806590_27_plen_91_part_00